MLSGTRVDAARAGIEGTVLVKMMASAEGGTSKVKEEPGERAAQQTMGEPTATTTATTKPDANVRPKTQQQPMFPHPPPLVGLPQPNAATASAMASMLASFPGGFDPAAFAKAAAAAFPGGLPKLAAAPPALAPFTAAAAPATSTASTASIKPATKRRKRGRAAGEGEDEEAVAGRTDAKADGGVAGRAAPATTAAANGGPLLAKLAEQPPGVAIPPQQAGGAGAGGKGGVWPSTGAGGAGAKTISVLTPNLFGDDMSNQERKVGRQRNGRGVFLFCAPSNK